MKLVVINNDDGTMQVGKDNIFYDGLDASALPSNIHAVQWDVSNGEIERKNAQSGEIIANEIITDLSNFQFAVDAWQSAYNAEQAAIALSQAKSDAYQSAYDQAIANGDSEEDANAAGQAASDAVTSV